MDKNVIKPVLNEEAMQKIRDEFQKAAHEISSIFAYQIAPAIQTLSHLMVAHMEEMKAVNARIMESYNKERENKDADKD
jgi:hypothetical protein